MTGKTIIPLCGGLMLLSTAAFASVSIHDKLGTEDAAITAKLVAAGYDVTEIERERDEIEIEATRNGRAYEFELDPKTGEVIGVELDDD